MKITLATALILILTFTKSFTQELRPGFIVTNKKDTLKGLITYQTDLWLRNKVEFKIDEKDPLTIYTTDDIESFGFENGRIFQRLGSTENPKDSFFAKRTLSGKLNLYVESQHKKKKEFYIQNNVSNERVHLVKPAKGKSTIESLQFIGLVNRIKNDSTTLFQNQKEIRFTETDLRQDLSTYNKRYQLQFPIAEYKEEKKVFYDFAIGAAVLSKPDANFRISLLRNSYHHDRNRVFSVISGVTYQRWSYSDKRIAEAEGDPWLRNNLKLIPIGINFQKLQGNIRPYIYSGFGVILSYSTYEFVQTITNVGSNGSGSNTTTQLLTTNEFEVGPTIVFGAGLKVKTGSSFIFFEVVPSDSGIFMNLGLSLQ